MSALACKLPVYAYSTSMGNSKFNVSDTSALFFFSLDFIRAQNMVWVIEGIRSDLRGNKNYFELVGAELSRAQVTKGKITVNV